MLAHKLRVEISAAHEVRFQLPKDFPVGEAEVIVLAGRQAGTAARGPQTEAESADPLARLLARFPGAGSLGPIAFHEDPTAPLDESTWPSDLKP